MKIITNKGEILDIKIVKNGNLYTYYFDGNRIGVYDPNKMRDDKILILSKDLEDDLIDQIKDSINQLDSEDIIKDAEELEKNLDGYAQSIGVEKEKIKRIAEINLDEKYEKDGDKKENDDELDKNNKEKNKNEKSKVNIKQEINLDDKADDIDTIRNWLGGNIPPEYTKIGIIESDERNKLKDENNHQYDRSTTRYSLVLENERTGEKVPIEKFIPQIKQRTNAGNNPTKENYQVKENGKVEKNNNLTELEIGNKTLSIRNGQYGEIEVYRGAEAKTSTDTIGIQLETDNVWPVDRETRSVIGKYEQNGERTVDENIKEAEKHEKYPNDKITTDEIDGDEYTGHAHDELTKEDIEMLEQTCKISEDEIKEKYDRIKENDSKLNKEEIMQEIEDEVNEDFRGSQEMNH